MGEWKEITIEEICERVSVGHVGPTTEFFVESDGVALVRSQDVRPGKLHVDSCARVTRSFHDEHRKSQLRPGDVLIVRVGANRGDVCAVPRASPPMNCANIVFARPKETTGYLSVFLRSEEGRARLMSVSTGSAQGVLNTTDIARLTVPYPPVDVQRRMAAVVGFYDDLIENNTRRIGVLEEMARVLFQEMRNAASRENDPAASTLAPASEAADYINGYAFKPSDFASSGMPIIKIRELKSGVDEQTPRYAAELDEKFRVVDGDLLFSWSADLNVYVWSGGEGWLNQHLFVVRARPGTEKSFLYHSLDAAMPQFRTMSNGATMKHIKRSALSEVKIWVATPEIQRRFARLADPMIEAVISLRRRNRALRAARDLLLPKLLSGELSVDRIPDPAEVAP